MSINKIFLEPDGLVVGGTQLVASGGGVSVGKNLSVIGNAYVSGSLYTSNIKLSTSLAIGNASSQVLTIDPSGNVGIGTSTPSSTLHVVGTANIYSTTASISTTTGAIVTAGGVGIGGNLNVGGNISINTNTPSTSTTTGAIVTTGGVGIGGNLNVGGTIASTGTTGNISGVNNLSTVSITTTGNVGVGTSSVTTGYILQVYGSDALINGITVGFGNSQVSNNTAFGYQALIKNTTGSGNHAFGYYSLTKNTTGFSNQADGYGTLYNNITGNNNQADGYASLFNNSSGNYNQAFGYLSLNKNTTGNSNQAMGYRSLYWNTTGNLNAAFGFYSGNAITGSNNTVIGPLAGSNITIGSNNTILGGYTGLTAPISQTGNNWVVLSDGTGTVRQVIDSNGNVGIGTTSPFNTLHVSSSTPGSQVTVQGTAAAGYTNMLLQGTGRTYAIGVGNSSETTYGVANKFAIGDNNASAVRMVIDSNGNVGIGTTAPLATLHVTGTHINTGNVGIGTSSTIGLLGSNVLTVFGNVNVISPSGAFLVNGVAIGGGGGGSVSITDDVATNTSEYLLSARATSGTASAVYTASSKLYFNPSTGTLNATVLNSLSDRRLKDNIILISNPIEKLQQLRGVTFDWQDNGNPSAGLIAQDVERVLPCLVNNDADHKTLNYNGIIGLLVEAVKELKNTVEQQSQEIDQLKSLLTAEKGE